MSNEFEMADYHRETMIYEKDQILAPLEDGMLSAPHPMVEGTTDGDYYRGKVTGVTQAQRDWVAQHRPEDPTLKQSGVKEVQQ